MTIAPVIAGSGLAGWAFLNATLDKQTALFNSSPDIARDVTYFKDNIANIKTLDDLMSDRKILKVVLGAYGLSDEINKGAFVRKVLEEGTTERSAFAVRLNNSDYLNLAEVLDFSEGELSLADEDISQLISKYQDEQFEVALGEVDTTQRLALNFGREMTDLIKEGFTEDTGWFKAMASTPLRTVLESAFALPSGFSQLDLDKQKDILAERTQKLTGETSINAFADSDNMNALIRRFLLNEQINAGPSQSTPGYSALSLLSGGLGGDGFANLILSNARL